MLGWLEIFAVAIVLVLLSAENVAILWVLYTVLVNPPEEQVASLAAVTFFVLIVRRFWKLGDTGAESHK